MNNFILEYWQGIRDGSIVVGEWVRLLYEIIVQRLDNGTYIFNQKKANNAIRFIEKFCRHNKGILAPELIKLSLWQKALISLIYGIMDQDGKRQFREIFLVVGRKNGKTLLASAIMSYEAFADGEFGSEIYCVAPKLDQSNLVYSAFQFTVSKTPSFKSILKQRKTDLYIKKSNTTIQKIAFNEKKADGYNPMLTIMDEMSSWPANRGKKQYDVMTSGTISRSEPLTVSISSSGYVNDGPYDELMKRSTSFLLGNSREKRLLPILYMIDDIENWDDINELRKSIPGLGVSIKAQTILDEIDIAHESLSKKVEFITKYCNIKQNSSQAWLPTSAINKAIGEELKLEDFANSYCVGGIDLSQTTDLTACVIAIEKNEKLNIFARFFLPSEKIDEASARDGIPYREYIKKGFLFESGQNFVDYKDCFDWFKMLVEKYKIYPLQIGYDRYTAQYLVQDMSQYGFHMDDVYQGENLTPVIRETEGLMKDGIFNIGNNDLLKMHLLDSAVKANSETNRLKLIKLDQRCHIDGTAALLDAMCVRQKWYEQIGAQLRNR